MFGKLKTAINFVNERPLNVILWKAYCKFTQAKMNDYDSWGKQIKGKTGLEIGGPSAMFNSNSYLPLYSYAKSVDGVNFSSNTIWEGSIKEGNTFTYNYNYKGRQFISEGTSLTQIPGESYDFVLSCNNLEHIANPIKALEEWKRVLIRGGTLFLILPNKESNFDHKRAITDFTHIVNDFKQNVNEDDLTHLSEVFRYHDLKRDPQAGNLAAFEKRCKENFKNRAIHHHVYNVNLLRQLVDFAGMKTLKTYSSLTDHFLLAVKE